MPEINAIKKLYDKELITEHQYQELNEHRALGIFSLHNEIRMLIFLSILLFTSGAGILIYKNIDSIGHIAILSLLLLITIVCFYFSFKHSKGFSNLKVVSEKPAYDYLVLTANLLSGIFIGYWQVQYNIFGTKYGLATLIPTLLYFFSAYYFDHKGVLSLAITGLFATVGFSTDPYLLLEGEFSREMYFSYSAILMAGALLVYSIIAKRINIKVHFNNTFLNFALHVIGIIGIINLFFPDWMLYFIVLAAAIAYFIYLAYQKVSLNFMVFSMVYGYITFNIVLSKFLPDLIAPDLLIYITPFYLVASILFFRMCLKNFKERTKHAGV